MRRGIAYVAFSLAVPVAGASAQTVNDMTGAIVGRRAAVGRVAAFIDVFNVFNANPAQNVSWVSGSSFLRPVAIIPPRIARVGVKVNW